MTSFSLHPTLVADCHELGAWKNLRVLLHKDACVRWFILVPETVISDWHELPGILHRQLLAASTVLARMMKADFCCDKVNVAAIGNLVPQFHYHVVGRWQSDPYWPGVVWGRVIPGTKYSDADIHELAIRSLQCLQSFEDK